MRVRRNFTREFKLSILYELNSGKSSAKICRENNIRCNLLSRWKREYKQDPRDAFAGNRNIWKEEAKIAEYERLLGQAHAEIAFLKKHWNTWREEEQKKRGCHYDSKFRDSNWQCL